MKRLIPYTALPDILVTAGLVALSINPEWTQGANSLNLLLAGAMCVSPAVLLIRKARVIIPRIDIPLATVCALVLAFPLLFHAETVRWTTMLFTCAWCVFFMMLARLTRISRISAASFMRIIRYVAYAYAGVLIIQQACLLAGLPVPLNDGGFLSVAPWKLNSLSAEPSHTTVILSTLMYFYTQTIRQTCPEESLWQSIKASPGVWICFTWTIFSTTNSSAFLLGPMCLVPYITRRNAWIAGTVIFAAAGIMFLTPGGDLPLISRLRDTIKATATLDEQRIINADESASARIVPTMRGIKATDLSDPATITGYGVDADKRDTAPRPCNIEGEGFAGIFSMWHNYGALCAIAFWTAIGTVTIIRRKWITVLTFLFALQMSADYNMQLVWLIMGWSMVYKYDICGIAGMLRPVTPESVTIKREQ